MKSRMLTGLASAVALVVALAACDTGPASGSGADIVDDEVADAADIANDDAGEAGRE